jgi:hypothetical protein
MQVMIERGCGLDVHQETVVACVLVGAPGPRPTKEVRTFRTMTRDLEALRDWLKAMGVTHVAMESTGIYWRPVYAVLEGHFELIVGNARHIRNVPGRKTDVKDAEWIAELVRQAEIFSIADHVCGSCGERQQSPGRPRFRHAATTASPYLRFGRGDRTIIPHAAGEEAGRWDQSDKAAMSQGRGRSHTDPETRRRDCGPRFGRSLYDAALMTAPSGINPVSR